MAVFIELVTDLFDEVFEDTVNKTKQSTRAGEAVVRRPLRGIEINEETHALLKMIKSDGKPIPLLDSSDPSGTSTEYTNFILQSVREQRMEKHQIIQTFGESYIYFFGEAPRFLECQATLVHSHDFNWEAEWWANYENYLRGTKSVEKGARTYMFYDNTIIEGFMLMAAAVKSSQQPYSVALSFQFFVIRADTVSLPGDPNFPIHPSVNYPGYIDLTRGDAWQTIVTRNLNQAQAVAARENANSAARLLRDRQFNRGFTGKTLTDVMRAVPRTILVNPDNQDLLPRSLPQNARGPLRSKIADNVDEYTGPFPGNSDSFEDLPAASANTARSQAEVQDLFRDSITYLSCFGANANSALTIDALGLGVNFLEKGARALGANKVADTLATYEPPPSRNGERVVSSFDDVGELFEDTREQVTDTTTSIARGAADPFGTATDAVEALQNSIRFRSGRGDPNYGYPSQYGGAGNGQAGFGDYGGNGFGSGFGEDGDPGHRPARELTYGGIADNRSSFERFLGDLGGGNGFGFGGNSPSESATYQVSGKVSAFSLVSVPGFLKPDGDAREDTTFGFGPANPFGVECPGAGFSGGLSYSFP